MRGFWSPVFVSFAAIVLAATATWAAEEKSSEGKELFLKYKCRSCHSIDAQGIEKKKAEAGEGEEEKAPADSIPKKKPVDLSGVGVAKTADWISKYLLKQEKLEAKLHKTKFRGTDEELQKLATWLGLLKTVKAGEASKAEAPEKAATTDSTAAATDSTTAAAGATDSTTAAPQTGK